MGDTVAPSSTSLTARYHALVRASKALAEHRSITELFQVIGRELHAVVPFDYLALVLHDAGADIMRLMVLEPEDLPTPPFSTMPVSAGGPAAKVWQTQQPLVVPIPETGDLPPALDLIRSYGEKVSCFLPLTTAHARLGVLNFGSTEETDYPAETIAFMEQVAAHVALAVDNALNFDRARRYEEELIADRNRVRFLLSMTNLLVSQRHYNDVIKAISDSLQPAVAHTGISLAIHDRKTNELCLRLSYGGSTGLHHHDLVLGLESTPPGIVFTSGNTTVFSRHDLDAFGGPIPSISSPEIEALCCVPLTTRRGKLGTLQVWSTDPAAFTAEDADLLMQSGGQIALALDAALAYREIAEHHNRLVEEKRYLEREISTEHEFGDIVGRSVGTRRVLKAVRTVAPTDATVLLLGETGTGKELFARAIHQLSGRHEQTFVRVSAAALPSGLLESELFGYEKGAFTGATASRIGRLELAHRGTLFLDEVGDLAPELQPKLLRVLQEREFERLGSTHTRKVDVRIIAATNRDLEKMVEAGMFRRDLYYRLNVFPILIPPLRERAEDIPALAKYFAERAARRMGKPAPHISRYVFDALVRWRWPGNIRELENVIERAVILSTDGELVVPMQEVQTKGAAAAAVAAVASPTLHDIKRDTILRALRDARGVVGGPTGAAARLGLKRTTLQSLMRRLDIQKPSY